MAIKLKIVPAPTFVAPVEIPVAGKEAGPVIDITWRHKGRQALLEWTQRALTGERRSDADLLDEVIAGWDELTTGVPYSRDALAQLFDDFPAASVAFAETFRRELLEGRRKNSSRSPLPGQAAA